PETDRGDIRGGVGARPGRTAGATPARVSAASCWPGGSAAAAVRWPIESVSLASERLPGRGGCGGVARSTRRKGSEVDRNPLKVDKVHEVRVLLCSSIRSSFFRQEYRRTCTSCTLSTSSRFLSTYSGSARPARPA